MQINNSKNDTAQLKHLIKCVEQVEDESDNNEIDFT